MVGGFGILLICIMIIRHIGGCIREANEDRQGRASELGADKGYYIGANASLKLRSDNRKVMMCRDRVKGRWLMDVRTLKCVSWIDKDEAIKGMREARAGGLQKGTVYEHHCGGGIAMFVDYATEEVYFLAEYRSCIKGHNKKSTWVYVDFDTQTKAIRKSDLQLEVEAKLASEGKENPYYDISEINIETNDHAHPASGNTPRKFRTAYCERNLVA